MPSRYWFRFTVVIWLIAAGVLTLTVSQAQSGSTYYVSSSGNDDFDGSISQPWRTIDTAVMRLRAGDTLYIRGGEYATIYEGWAFHHSGTEAQPIIVSNYPGEQVILRINNSSEDYQAFACWGRDYKADYIHITGSDVEPVMLPNGVRSEKGLVILGPDLVSSGQHTISAGIIVRDCDYWEISGVDFVDVGYGIFQLKDYTDSSEAVSTTDWHVHDNRVHGFYAESGMQFNGDHNLIENNVIRKVHDQHFTPWGCQHINILGYENTVRGNTLAESGSADFCFGVTLEWDLADKNIIERNKIIDTDAAILFLGGDNNVIRNNLMVVTTESNQFIGAITILSTEDSGVNYCNSEPAEILPPDDPSHPEYAHYYTPRNCHSYGNIIINNTLYGYTEGIRLYDLVPDATVIKNNIIAEHTRGAICPYDASSGTCKPLPDYLETAANRTNGDMGFKDVAAFDFSLKPDSQLIDAGVNVFGLVDDDLNGSHRPLGDGYDIGAFEFDPGVPPPLQESTMIREAELLAALRDAASPHIEIILVLIGPQMLRLYCRVDDTTGMITASITGADGLLTVHFGEPQTLFGLPPPGRFAMALHQTLPGVFVAAFDRLIDRYLPASHHLYTFKLEHNQFILVSDYPAGES